MRLFISHVHEEAAIAEALQRQFDHIFANMVQCFLSENITLGADWLAEIKSELNAADLIVVLFSQMSQSRPWINIEAGYGVMAGKSVIPVCHSGLTKDRLPVIYGLRQGLNLVDRADTLRLLETVAAATSAKRLLVEDREKVLDEWLRKMAQAAAQVPAYRPPVDAPILVWVIGSVADVDAESKVLAFKAAEGLADTFVERGFRVVLGRNHLLNYVADRAAPVSDVNADEPTDIPQLLARKSSRSGANKPNPLIVLGSLRSPRGIRHVFLDSIGKVPDVCLVIGGALKGRAIEEARLANEANIPILPLKFTGGAALRVNATFDCLLSSAIDDFQKSPGSDALGRMVCDLIERQVGISRGA